MLDLSCRNGFAHQILQHFHELRCLTLHHLLVKLKTLFHHFGLLLVHVTQVLLGRHYVLYLAVGHHHGRLRGLAGRTAGGVFDLVGSLEVLFAL